MNTITVLIEGYAREIKGGWLASSTTTLIESNGKKIIVDPGINKTLLLSSLTKINLKTSDIDMVFLSHFHLDHSFLAPLFEKAKILDGETIYEADKETEYSGKIPGTDIEVVLTPGHAKEHSSLIVPTKEGKIVIAQDCFLWMDSEKQDTTEAELLINRDDPFMMDKGKLIESRKKILEIADWIIPGHGKMFRNPLAKKVDFLIPH